MRIIAGENFPKLVVEVLRAVGHDVVWVRTDFPGWSDTVILDFAESESRLILTLDKEFLADCSSTPQPY